MTFRMAVRTVAKRHGLHATFMPKPRSETAGSGMHLHFSLFKNGRNIFDRDGASGELSDEALYFIGGLLAHSREMALITNPLVNSYKRLVPGYGAPTELTWTEDNQNSLVRIPVGRGEDTRIELRSPDARPIRIWCWLSAWRPDWTASGIRRFPRRRPAAREGKIPRKHFRRP